MLDVLLNAPRSPYDTMMDTIMTLDDISLTLRETRCALPISRYYLTDIRALTYRLTGHSLAAAHAAGIYLN